jgi:hypothetical protein
MLFCWIFIIGSRYLAYGDGGEGYLLVNADRSSVLRSISVNYRTFLTGLGTVTTGIISPLGSTGYLVILPTQPDMYSFVPLTFLNWLPYLVINSDIVSIMSNAGMSQFNCHEKIATLQSANGYNDGLFYFLARRNVGASPRHSIMALPEMYFCSFVRRRVRPGVWRTVTTEGGPSRGEVGVRYNKCNEWRAIPC